VWEIRQFWGLYVDRGGFHIWPEGTDVSEESDRTEQAVLTMMRQEFGGPFRRALRGLIFLGVAVALPILLRWILKY
jgi:CRISPR/Cas system CMR-associated protein Cmr1 (group 7 of RAMP superfamily)